MQKACSSSFKQMVSDRLTRTCQDSDAMKKRPYAFNSLLVFLFVLTACTHLPDRSVHKTETETVSATTEAGFRICASCTRNQAQGWAAAAIQDGASALKAANCYAFLVKQGKDKKLRLADAEKGRKLAKTAVTMLPRSGLAHYLYAYLTGLEAENDPLRGLELVPVIEREALLASDLNPAIDHGGPHRMLGELYLRAPAFPVSIGDSARAVDHYRLAVDQDPEFFENRLGLAEALLAEEEPGKACFELKKILSEMPPNREVNPPWKRALELLKRLCDMQEVE